MVPELEQATSGHSDRISTLEATIITLSSQVKRLEDRCEQYEQRSRLNNIRVFNVCNNSENGSRVTDFVAQLLKDLLNLDEKPLLDRAHRTGNWTSDSPRPIIARIHFLNVRSLILQHASEASPLIYKDERISIFPDQTQAVVVKQAAFGAVKRTLHSFPNVKFGLLYPATLKITKPDETVRWFVHPDKAIEFVQKDCK